MQSAVGEGQTLPMEEAAEPPATSLPLSGGLATDLPPSTALEPALPADLRRRGQVGLIRTAMSAAVVAATLMGTTLATLFLLSLDASPFTIGLLVMLLNAAPLGQVVGLHYIHRVGKVGLVFWGRVVQLLPAGVLVALSALGVRGDWVIVVAIALFSLLAMLSSVTFAPWWPLIQDNIEPDRMGAFFARMRTRLRSVDVGVPLLVGAYLGTHPSLQRFFLPFLVGWLAMAMGTWFIRKVPELPMDPPREGLWRRLAAVGRTPPVRRYMVYLTLFWFLLSLFQAFWVVILTAKPENPHSGLPAGNVVWLSAIAAFGHVLGLKLWSRMVDRHGGRSVLALSQVGAALLGLAWLILPQESIALRVWAVLFFLLWGLLEGGMLMGRTWTMIRCVDRAHQADGFTLICLAGSAGAAVGGLVGGTAFDALTSMAWRGTVLGLDPRCLFLCLAQLSLVLAFWAGRRLAGHDRQTPARRVLASLLTRRDRPS